MYRFLQSGPTDSATQIRRPLLVEWGGLGALHHALLGERLSRVALAVAPQLQNMVLRMLPEEDNNKFRPWTRGHRV